ncbi:MAG: hypothetical protein JW986_11030, partial [Methanotrichaceae archaeon]|nr:hypothetical protein [Methanotrichaceae archaeon]
MELPSEEAWRSEMVRLLINGFPIESSAASKVVDLIFSKVIKAAQTRGPFTAEVIIEACTKEGIEGLNPLSNPFQPIVDIDLREDGALAKLAKALNPGTIRPKYVNRPELQAFSENSGAFILGKKGIGKTEALIHLAMARPDMPVVVVKRGFGRESLSYLFNKVRLLRRQSGGHYQLIWDDIQKNPMLFAQVMADLSRQGGVRILCAGRIEDKSRIIEEIPPLLRQRAGLQDVTLSRFEEEQAFQMAQSVARSMGLEMEDSALKALADQIRRGDGGPLYAIVLGRLLQVPEKIIRLGDVQKLNQALSSMMEARRKNEKISGPAEADDLQEAWLMLYNRLEGRSHQKNLLRCLSFLHEISCPPLKEIVRLLYTSGLGLQEKFDDAVEELQGLWLQEQGGEIICHDVSLEAVPKDGDRFQRLALFAHQDIVGNDLGLGLLRASLSTYIQKKVPTTTERRVRRDLLQRAKELGELAIVSFRGQDHKAHLGTALSNTSYALSELAGLETRREGRQKLLEKAIAYIEEAIKIRRDLGLMANVATSLNNASNLYSNLAGLETSREGRQKLLEKAIAYIEEAIKIRRELGMMADVAMSLNNASNLYSNLAGLETSREGRQRLLEMAISYIEEAIQLYRDLGLMADVAMSLNNASNRYSYLAGLETSREGR